MSKHYLHFTLGPVQAFVGQSRRTRDLWASSWLLSQLAGRAMRAALPCGGELVLPKLGGKKLDDLLAREHACLPNRFTAEFASEEAARAGATAAANAIRDDWQALAEAVWKKFVDGAAANGAAVRAIWDRQVAHFWEIAWAITADATDTSLLDQRKNWRTGTWTLEGGEHCTLMGRWQELSGYTRSTPQKAFWEAIRRHAGGAFDLAEDERLCAIALVKRVFPKLDTTELPTVWQPQTAKIKQLRGWPSTVYMAAVPWLVEVGQHSDARTAAKHYLQTLTEQKAPRSETRSEFPCLKEFPEELKPLLHFDGNFFNLTALENKNGTPLLDESKRPELLKSLRSCNDEVGSAASNYYALLLMDGDSMGARLGNPKLRDGIGEGLIAFAENVPGIVEAHNGKTIYAGGDDVLALLALPEAIECAAALRREFADVLKDQCPADTEGFTLSGALLFCHYKAAFSRVLKEAHRLLDDVAKDATGRDSLAVAIVSQAGTQALYAAPWSWLGLTENHRLKKLQALITKDNEAGDKLSNSYLYRMQDLIGRLAESFDGEPGKFVEVSSDIDLQKLLVAEWFVGKRPKDATEAKEMRDKANDVLIRPLLEVSQRVTRQDGSVNSEPKTFALDAVRIAKFLNSGGKESA